MSGRAGLHLREGRTSSPGGRSWARRCNSGRPEVGRSWPHLRILKSGPEFKPAVRMSSPVSGLHFRVRRKWAEYLAELRRQDTPLWGRHYYTVGYVRYARLRF